MSDLSREAERTITAYDRPHASVLPLHASDHRLRANHRRASRRCDKTYYNYSDNYSDNDNDKTRRRRANIRARHSRRNIPAPRRRRPKPGHSARMRHTRCGANSIRIRPQLE